MTTVYVLLDGGYSDKSVQAVFSTREKAEAFVARFEGYDCGEIVERALDEMDVASWSPGRSWWIHVRPWRNPAYGPTSVQPGFMAINIDRATMHPEACTRQWRVDQYSGAPSYRTEFWGSYEEAKAFAEAKLVEEQAKPPPCEQPGAYTGRRV